MKIHEIWYFPEDQCIEGLFTRYVDTWLKMKQGGAAASTVKRILRQGPTTTDKFAKGLSMFLLGPSPSFDALGRLLAKQVFKGVKDNVEHYRKRKNTRTR